MMRGSAVGIVTGYGLDPARGRNSSRGRVKNFHFSTLSKPALGSTQPPFQCVPEAVSPEIKRQGREAGHSLLTIAAFKKTWICTSAAPYVFMT
jgi:hypothetical protein